MESKAFGRREFFAFAVTMQTAERVRPLSISVNVMLDHGAHAAKRLSEAEISKFKRFQETARREYAASGIVFDLRYTDEAYLRMQGYSDIPDKFLARGTINLFVTDSLGYDIDRDRTGGCSMGPHPRMGTIPADPFYKTFLGLHEAR